MNSDIRRFTELTLMTIAICLVTVYWATAG